MNQIFDWRIAIVFVAAAAGAWIGVLLEPYGIICMLLYCFESGSTGSMLGAAFIGGGWAGVLAWILLSRSTDPKQ